MRMRTRGGDLQRVHLRAQRRHARAAHRARHRLGWGLVGMYLARPGRDAGARAADVAVVQAVRSVARSRRPICGTALRFGLPRVPHGLAQQALDGGNKLLLERLHPAGRSWASTRTRRRSAPA